MKKDQIVFITDFSPKKGIGHVIRASWLSEYFKQKGYHSIIFIRGKWNEIKDSFQTVITVTDLRDIVDLLDDFEQSILFFDLPPDVKKGKVSYESLLRLFKSIRKRHKDKFLYSAFDDPEILGHRSGLITFSYQTINRYQKHDRYVGMEYTPLSGLILNKKSIPYREGLLVFFGGSDPAGHTGKIIRMFSENEIRYDGNIYIIIGYNHRISYKKYDLPAKIKLINHPRDWTVLLPFINKAIISGGLLKYDLMYLGIPMLIVPQNVLELKCLRRMDLSCNKNSSFTCKPGPEAIEGFLWSKKDAVNRPGPELGQGMHLIFEALTGH